MNYSWNYLISNYSEPEEPSAIVVAGVLSGGISAHMPKALALVVSSLALILPGETFAQSRKMSGTCVSQDNLNEIGANALGYAKSRTSKDAETRAADGFALTSAARLTYQIKDARWQRDIDGEGRCMLSLILILPPDLVESLGGVSPLAGNVELRLREAGGKWSLANEFGDFGIPKNDFRDHFRPYVYTEVRRQIAAAKRLEADRQRAELAVRKQAEADAEAAFKRDYPREWAAEQNQKRVQRERREQEIAEHHASEQRKAEACEANGGTWGYKINRHGIKVSQTGCFFRIAE